ncbi:MAG TPA: DUF3857 and transglutaminase domain-containing protein [Patescibacteria group bacterium]|nr:DUF3857 and transglutaminase domain-containing protein [Patescibacteria group bacterium]
MNRIVAAAVAIFVFSGCITARAADEAPAEESFKFTKLYYDDVVNEDGTQTTKLTIGMKVLRQDALEEMKQYPISYSTSAEKVEVLEAYTLKPDGRRVDAAKNNFQVEVNGGRAGAAPAFSDASSLTVVFPDVEVGDTVNVVYNRSVTDPLFPKEFDDTYSFSRNTLYDDVSISYSIPLSLGARYRNFGLTETVNKTENGRQLLTWTFKNTEVKKAKYKATPVFEFGDRPGVIISTFKSYKEFAESYGARANPKAKVTPEIQKLADGITKGKTGAHDQAKALYEWEIANMTYAGNCIGIGAVVPRDLDFVLKNRMGDCKDHATLLQALLAAKGIESTQALIGVNSIYKLPEIPLVEIVNHVIDYIPSLDMYLDATSGMPFGYLPASIAGKPVLLVDGYKEGTMTPKRPAGLTKVKVDAKVTIAEDGTADGVTTIATTAPEGGSYSGLQALKAFTPKKIEEANEHALEKSGYQGSVDMDAGTWDEKTMTFTRSVRFHFKDYIHPGMPGAIYAEPPFSSQPIGDMVAGVIRDMAMKDPEKMPHGFKCSDGLVEENYEYVFPKNAKVLGIPNNLDASVKSQSYSSKYKLDGQILTVSRKMTDTSPSPVCPEEIVNEYEQLAAKVWPDLKAQVVYK